MAMYEGQGNVNGYRSSAPVNGHADAKRPAGSNICQWSRRLGIIGKWFKPVKPPLVEPNIIEATKPGPKKRALLIGISSILTTQQPSQVARGEGGILNGPHKDVAMMKKLLIEKYGYGPNDITTLLDNKDPKQKKPTRDNMMAEMQNLIKDAVPGDRFFFHYAGHAAQAPNEEEEDGMDECLVPCDSTGEENDDKLIKDDVLQSILVENLPAGCQLIAIFDSCHSASLLDLKHFRCNRVYVPWVSKGPRRSDSMRNITVRQQAANVNIPQTERISNNAVKSHKMSHGVLNGPSDLPPPPPAMPASNPADFNTGFNSLPPLSLDIRPWLGGDTISGFESPIKEVCEGFCRESSPTTPARWRSTSGSGRSPVSISRARVSLSRTREKPENVGVISLGACKDSQLAWEDSVGSSMTQCLVEILSKDPHPTFRDLMLKLNHATHNRLLHIHEETKNYKKIMKLWRQKKNRRRSPGGDTKGREMTNFQDPQLSSQKPLDMNRRLIL